MKTKKYGIFYVCLAAALVAGAVVTAFLAGCDNPSASTGGNETPGNTVGITIDLGGSQGLGLAGGTIYVDREPSRLELTVAGTGWDSLDWNLDGKNVAAWKNQAAVTMNAADYAEARHTLALTGIRGGARYSTSVPVTVTRERPGLIWTQTAEDSSLTAFDLAAWQGESGPVETWALSVLEQPVLYFAARKSPDALATVKGVTGGAVSKAALGETLDGSVADETLDLFTVKFGKDALFGEGACSFTLELTEPGKQPKTVKISAAVRPNLTGIAVFRRVADGSLARITAGNAKAHANTLYADHKDKGFPAPGLGISDTGWGIDFAHVQNLSTALKWLDNYARGGTAGNWAEYLVRVEADEAMPKTLLTCRMNESTDILAEYIRIRIRGYGKERTITHDPSSIDTGTVNKGGPILSANRGFLSIGPQTGGDYVPNHLAVFLENNITINAAGGTNQFFPNGAMAPFITSMIAVSWGNTLVMEAGSRLTNYVYISVYNPSSAYSAPYYDRTAVEILRGGVFEWRAGEISNIQGDGAIVGQGNIVLCALAGSNMPDGEFYYSGAGIMYGNTKDQIAVGSYFNPSFYAVSDQPLTLPVP
jgi:hypothetical protein